MDRYSKFLGALAGLIGLVGFVVSDGQITAVEWGELVTSTAGVVAVWGLRNRPEPHPLVDTTQLPRTAEVMSAIEVLNRNSLGPVGTVTQPDPVDPFWDKGRE